MYTTSRINWSNFIFVATCFLLFVPFSVNIGLLIGNHILIKYLSSSLLNITFTSTICGAGLLLTQQTISYLYTNKLTVKPAYYILPFVFLVILNAASSILLAMTVKGTLIAFFLVLGALSLGGVILRHKNLIKFRIVTLLASLFLFLLGITLMLCNVTWMFSVFKILMCVVFFCRLVVASNYLVRFYEKESISEKQVWLSTRLVNESIFVYLALLGNIVSL